VTQNYVIFSTIVSCVGIIIYSQSFQLQNQTSTTYQQETRVSFQNHYEIIVLLGAFSTAFFTTFTMSISSVTSEILTDSRQGKFLKHFRQLVF